MRASAKFSRAHCMGRVPSVTKRSLRKPWSQLLVRAATQRDTSRPLSCSVRRLANFDSMQRSRNSSQCCSESKARSP
jgi:hypothetical protein